MIASFYILLDIYRYFTISLATLPLRDINTEAWSSGMGVGRGANNPAL
jgi:hypothetical protein